jgi:hypothetical protein
VLHGGNLENGSGKGEGFILRKFHESTFSGTVFEIMSRNPRYEEQGVADDSRES